MERLPKSQAWKVPDGTRRPVLAEVSARVQFSVSGCEPLFFRPIGHAGSSHYEHEQSLYGVVRPGSVCLVSGHGSGATDSAVVDALGQTVLATKVAPGQGGNITSLEVTVIVLRGRGDLLAKSVMSDRG